MNTNFDDLDEADDRADGLDDDSGEPGGRRRGAKASAQEDKRLAAIKSAARRVDELRSAGVDLTRAYKIGDRVFDSEAEAFGEVIYAGDGYIRLQLRDGSERTHGRPPMDDRKAFIIANFERMDNKAMAEIVDISVHTMRRLCHEYGLKRRRKASTKKA